MLYSGPLKPGNIFVFPDYYFENTGETKDKYGIIVSDNDVYYAILICFTTSRVEKYKEKLPQSNYVFIEAGISYFPKDTLILINETNIHKIERDKFIEFSPKYVGDLDSAVFEELLGKLKISSRISDFYKGLL